MDKPFVVYGAPGTGSVIIEAALTLMGLPYDVMEQPPLNSATRDQRAAEVNPLRQLPVLVLPSGEILTESMAILIWLADSHPRSGLSPGLRGPARAAFLRWMAFVSSQIYALYWVRDDPARLADDKSHQAVIQARTKDRIAHCWRAMDSQISPADYILGDRLSVLDLYVAVISRWGPRRVGFYSAAPKMADIVRRVDADPRLHGLWASRFPFVDGWEGETDA